MKKMKVLLVASILFSTLIVGPSVGVASESVIDNSQISTFKPIIEWRYKLINGILHKRQFNHSTLKWLGEWVRV
ncbi:hypothetical protein [Enterococcus sp. LJL120]